MAAPIAVLTAARANLDDLCTSSWRLLCDDRLVLGVLVVLMGLDAVFIGIHVYRGVLKDGGAALGLLADSRFSLLKDRGYAEIFNYLKAMAAVALLVAVSLRRRQPIYVALAAILAAALIDDSMQVHEAGGYVLLDWVGRDTPLGIHVRDLGELATWALLGIAALVALIAGWRRSPDDDNRVALLFIGCLALLAAFGIGVDLLHALAPTRALDGVFGTLEDGGELLVWSLTTAVALVVFRHGDRFAIVPRRRPA